MNNFDYNVPTKVFFGKGQLGKIAEEIPRYGKRVLLTFGKGHIRKNGLYDQVTGLLKAAQIEYFELDGIKPNPGIQSVRKGVEICRRNNVDLVLAIGGGSVIDASKAIAAGVFYDGDPWDFYTYKAQIKRALPVGTVLTLAATGSEMNGNSVITNEDEGLKMAAGSDLLRPVFSVLDPVLTFSVNSYHTAAGVADIMSHCIEQYFSAVKGTYVQDRMTEAILKTAIHFGPVAMAEPENYTARANLMWAGSLALNGGLQYGKKGDWATHAIEHIISAKYDLTHGVGLAILTPYWMTRVLSEETIGKFISYAMNVWKIEGDDPNQIAKEGISKTALFFESLGIPKKLSETGIHLTPSDVNSMAEILSKYGPLGNIRLLDKEDITWILKAIC